MLSANTGGLETSQIEGVTILVKNNKWQFIGDDDEL